MDSFDVILHLKNQDTIEVLTHLEDFQSSSFKVSNKQSVVFGILGLRDALL